MKNLKTPKLSLAFAGLLDLGSTVIFGLFTAVFLALGSVFTAVDPSAAATSQESIIASIVVGIGAGLMEIIGSIFLVLVIIIGFLALVFLIATIRDFRVAFVSVEKAAKKGPGTIICAFINLLIAAGIVYLLYYITDSFKTPIPDDDKLEMYAIAVYAGLQGLTALLKFYAGAKLLKFR